MLFAATSGLLLILLDAEKRWQWQNLKSIFIAQRLQKTLAVKEQLGSSKKQFSELLLLVTDLSNK